MSIHRWTPDHMIGSPADTAYDDRWDTEPECRHCFNLYAYAPNEVIAKHESQEGCGGGCCRGVHVATPLPPDTESDFDMLDAEKGTDAYPDTL